jgi:uncharacterized delta-60 repeat protein
MKLITKNISAVIAVTAFILFLTSNLFGTDLTVDSNFNPPRFVVPDSWVNIAVQPDGKILRCLAAVIGGFGRDTLVDQDSGLIVRYLPDGTLDPSFNCPTRDYSAFQVVAVAPSGKLIVSAIQGDPSHPLLCRVLRLNSDGSIDNTFDSSVTSSVPPTRIMVEPDGKILVAGTFTNLGGAPYQLIARLMPDGGLDSSFAALTFTPAPLNVPFINSIPVIQPDGKIIIAGSFNSVNGVARPSIARLNPDGSLDTSFVPTGIQPTNGLTNYRSVVLRTDGKIILPGRFTVPASFASNPTGATYNRLPMLLLNSDGTVDQSFGYFGSLNFSFGSAHATFSRMRDLQAAPDNSLIGLGLNGIYRFNANGSLNSFLAIVTDSQLANATTSVNRLVVQSDGQVLVPGGFTHVYDSNGVDHPRNGFFRVAFDGTIDAFNPAATGKYVTPGSFFRRVDGTTLIAFGQAGFDDVPGTFAIPHNLGRLNTDGSLDNAFDPIASFPTSGPLTNFIAAGFNLLPDGNLFLFTGVNVTVDNSSHGYGRISQDGTLDTAFGDSTFDGSQYMTAPDGSVIAQVGGDASVYQTGQILRRIGTDGTVTNITVDSAIVAAMNQTIGGVPTFAQSSRIVGILNDGRILFSYLASDSIYHLVRLNPDGTIDPGFQEGVTQSVVTPIFTPVAGQVLISALPAFTDSVITAGGTAIITGYFANYNGVPQHGIVRLNSDGTIDTSFHSGGGAQYTQTIDTGSNPPSIDNIEPQNDGGFLITGTFEAFDGTAAPGIGNLRSDGSFDPTFSAPVVRDNLDPLIATLGLQQDGSFLLSGPYHLPNQSRTPNFVRLTPPAGAISTPDGTSVTISVPPVASTTFDLTFPTVTLGGVTNIVAIDPAVAGSLPDGYTLPGTNLAFEINTTSRYTTPVVIAFHVPSVDSATFSQLRVLHNDGNGLIDVTADNPAPDAATQTIYAKVNSLSPFVLAKRTTPPGCQFASFITANFNGTAIAAGNYIWFNSVLKPSGVTSARVTMHFTHQRISSANFSLPIPDADVIFDPAATSATTMFTGGKWVTQAPASGISGNTFLAGFPYQVPANLPGGIKNVTWSATVIIDTVGAGLSWKWSAAVYRTFSSDPAALGVKPVDDNKASIYKNSDHAGTPENFKTFVTGGAMGGGGSNYTGGLSGTAAIGPCKH